MIARLTDREDDYEVLSPSIVNILGVVAVAVYAALLRYW